ASESYDYIIADPVVLPMNQQRFYAEKIVHLPDSYQANDSRREIASNIPTRAEFGLPELGFVYCCFNGNQKITPPSSPSGCGCCRGLGGGWSGLCALTGMPKRTFAGKPLPAAWTPRDCSLPTMPHPKFIWADTGLPICFSTPCHTMRIRPRAKRCGQASR